MIGTESLIDCLRTSFGRIRSRRSSKILEDIWSTNVMMETSDQVCMVVSKWAYSREIFKMSWIFLLKLCGVETFLCNVVFLSVLRKIFFFFPFSNEQKVVLSNRSFGWSWHSIAKPFSFIRKDQGHWIQVNNLAFLLWALWDWILTGNQGMCMIVLEELRVFTESKQRECIWFRNSFHLRLIKGTAPSLRIFIWGQIRGVPLILEFILFDDKQGECP